MSVTGNDIQSFMWCENKASTCDLKIIILGSDFILDKNGQCLGSFNNVDSLYNYLCGYESGFDDGKAHASEEGFVNRLL